MYQIGDALIVGWERFCNLEWYSFELVRGLNQGIYFVGT